MYWGTLQRFGGEELWRELLKTLSTVAKKHGVSTGQRVAEMGHAAGEARGGRKFKREWVLRCGGVGLWAPGSIITAESLIYS
jgi:hypothetical protein